MDGNDRRNAVEEMGWRWQLTTGAKNPQWILLKLAGKGVGRLRERWTEETGRPAGLRMMADVAPNVTNFAILHAPQITV